MNISRLIAHLDACEVRGDVGRDVSGVTRDTREVSEGSVFVAIRGARVDGHDLVGSVPQAAAVVVERDVQAPRGVAVIQVADTKRALALLAAAFHGHPGAAMKVIGVTGTNGKTTVTTVVEEALVHAGYACGRIGTTGVSRPGHATPSSLTTPEAPQLQEVLAQMRDSGVQAVAMEVSSIGVDQHRVRGIPFHTGVFTNLSRDHLDYHGTMDAYLDCKRRLFTELLRPAGGPPRALLCADDPAWPQLSPPDDRWLYGFSEDADIRITAMDAHSGGTRLSLRTPEGEGTLSSPLVGRYNALNLAAAVGCCLTVGLDLATALAAVGSVRGVAGRFEPVDNDRGLLVLVDYAHTEDALRAALQAARDLTTDRLWVVFGCGGDRDQGKRPRMGRVAEGLADAVVVTSDNPRTEDPQRIVDAILEGMERPPLHVDVDRARAIGWALSQARAGEVVVIAGKGHETYQEIDGVRHPFDDRIVARDAMGGAS